MGKALKRWWPLFMLPTCLAFMIGFVIPFIQGFYLSFCQFIIINNAHFVGIENYVRALSDPQFSTSFFFTVAFAFLSTVLINVDRPCHRAGAHPQGAQGHQYLPYDLLYA